MEREWIVKTIDELAQFGRNDTGITRLAYSEQERLAREYIAGVMDAAGLSTRIDEAGNVIGRLEGRDAAAPAVITGSHIDTVPDGGKFDGIVGIVGAIDAIRSLAGTALKHSVEVVAFAAKESSRFGYMTIGSRSMAGNPDIASWRAAVDKDGVSFGDALQKLGMDVELLTKAGRRKSDIKAYVELHVEQGPILDKDDIDIGVIESIAGVTRLKITVDGVAANSGSTPMGCRNDALVSAAMIVLAVQDIAMEQSYQDTVATVGKLLVYPGAVNVIPGRVELFVDIRGTSQKSVIELLQAVMDEVTNIADQQETTVAMTVIYSEKPAVMDADITDIIESAGKNSGFSCRRMVSGAGHDAMSMARIVPTGMIFIPSHNGLSHNASEYADINDIMAGVQVLTAVLQQLAQGTD